MPITIRCGCGKSFQVPDAMAGKRGRCKACGSTLVVPDAIDDDDAATMIPDDSDSDDAVAAAVIPPTPPINISLQPRRRSRVSTPKSVAREPWFYWFLELSAGLVLLAAAFQALAAAIAVMIAFTAAEESSPGALAGAMASATTAGIAFAGCLGSITLAALIKMLVDIGRSLRRINQSANA